MANYGNNNLVLSLKLKQADSVTADERNATEPRFKQRADAGIKKDN